VNTTYRGCSYEDVSLDSIQFRTMDSGYLSDILVMRRRVYARPGAIKPIIEALNCIRITPYVVAFIE
jgi:hypothetical protein